MSNIEAFKHIRDQRVIEKTKKGYLSKLNVLRRFLKDHGYEDRFIGENDEILIHLASIEDQVEVLTDFFGWLAVNTDLPKQRRIPRNIEGNTVITDNAVDSSNVNHVSNFAEFTYDSSLIYDTV